MLQSSVHVLRLSRRRIGAEHGVALWRLFSDALTPGATNAEASQTPKAALRAQSQIQEVDVNYRSPTERVWPASPRQQKVGSRVLRALEMTLSEPKYMQTLVKQYGLCFEEVRMSPDMLVAYVLWSAHPEHEERTQQELHRQLSKIRMSLGRGLKARNVPRLEFRHNALSASQQAVEQEFERLAKLEED